MNKVLVMNFLTSNGTKASVRFKGIKDDLDASAVNNAMEALIEKNILMTSGGDLALKDSACILTTTSKELAI
ncbi:DUF2922 domain-containing protein [Clostridium aestuarii]|uniref:DUF2922 domain-containing protein n=1 Tax=Clostridium aestuarii TaxID=338193 RepID=A0ABT4D2B7_9CLOT|nr:DUF2922 domain-containing protein [Clostridium aestuarii]MCY6485389.1 DUF2922 domain-containing protein [Clostridium aestuarii]